MKRNIDIGLIKRMLETLRAKGFALEKQLTYNPMEEFSNALPQKEIAHSRVLCELLNPDGAHGQGTKYLESFMEMLRLDSKTLGLSIAVSRERHVKVQRKPDRSIDIFVEWEKSGKRYGIIIENKLNNAKYQPNQLKDYKEAINREGYILLSTVCLHQTKSPDDAKIKEANVILYPDQLAAWINRANATNSSPGISAYATYLMNLHTNNIDMDNAKMLLDLNSDVLDKIELIANAYNDIPKAKAELLISRFAEDETLCTELVGNYFKVWKEKDRKRNGIWVTICLWQHSYVVYLTSESDRERTLKKYAKRADYVCEMADNGCVWYYNSNENERIILNAPISESLDSVIAETKRLLAVLAK